MDKKYSNAPVSRREALKKIGQCAEYSGAVVAFLSVSQPAWASFGTGTSPGCQGLNISASTPHASISGCVDLDVDSSGLRAHTWTGADMSIQNRSSQSGSLAVDGRINNRVSGSVDTQVEQETLMGPSYQ